MSEDRWAHVEYILAFFLKEGTDKTRGINCVGIFIANDEAKTLTEIETALEHIDIFLQLLECDSFLRQIKALRTGSQRAHHSEIAAPMPHHFDHEATARGNRRLFDFIDRVNDIIQCSICTDAEFG